MENIYADQKDLMLASAEKRLSSQEMLQSSQKFEAFINSLANIVAKYGNEVLAEVNGAA